MIGAGETALTPSCYEVFPGTVSVIGLGQTPLGGNQRPLALEPDIQHKLMCTPREDTSCFASPSLRNPGSAAHGYQLR